MALRLQFKVISNTDLMTQYRDLTKRYLDIDFPEEYLNRSKVIALVSQNGQQSTVVGGFMIAQSGPFRVLQQIPDHIVEQNEFLQKRMHRTLEITGLWVHPRIRAGHLRCRLWLRLFRAVLAEGAKGRRYFVYSYDASKKKLGDVYSTWNPERIFEGLVFIPGMKESTHEIVEMAALHSCILAFFTKPLFFGKRFFRKLGLQKRKVLSASR
jgi:hypothetical protein